MFEVTDKRPVLIAERDVKGAVLTLAMLRGKLLAGINTKVQLYIWAQKDDVSNSYELKLECSHHGHTMALFIKTRAGASGAEDVILVGDLIRSVALLQYRAEENLLEETCRDFNTNFMRAIEIIDENHFLGSEDNGNMFVLRTPGNKASFGSTSLLLNDEEKCRLGKLLMVWLVV